MLFFTPVKHLIDEGCWLKTEQIIRSFNDKDVQNVFDNTWSRISINSLKLYMLGELNEYT